MNRITEARTFIAKNNIDVPFTVVRELLKTVDGLSTNAYMANVEQFLTVLESELSYFTDAQA